MKMKARNLAMWIQHLVALFLVGVTMPAFGQVEAGRFVGNITDAQGAGVPHAIVKATNTGTNIVQAAITDSSGDFVITPVAAGVYSLSVTATGFETNNTPNFGGGVATLVRGPH